MYGQVSGTTVKPWGRVGRGWTFVELMAVVLLVAAALVIGGLSLYRGKAAAEQLSCQDNMRAVHSALQIYWEKNQRTYPVGQPAFEQFLASPTYCPEGELHCPQDENRTSHYRYTYTPTAVPSPTDVKITCPTPDSGHGSI